LCECEILDSLTHLVSFFLDREDIRKLSMGGGGSGNVAKEECFFNVVWSTGHKEPVLRTRGFGPGNARTPLQFNSVRHNC